MRKGEKAATMKGMFMSPTGTGPHSTVTSSDQAGAGRSPELKVIQNQWKYIYPQEPYKPITFAYTKGECYFVDSVEIPERHDETLGEYIFKPKQKLDRR